MPMINFTEPLALFIALLAFVLVLWFSYQSKKSVITGIMLFIFIAILVDLVFIFLSFISYLWIDDVEAKLKKKKVIDNSLDWFWSETKF